MVTFLNFLKLNKKRLGRVAAICNSAQEGLSPINQKVENCSVQTKSDGGSSIMENCWVTCPRALCTPYCNSSPRNGVKFTTDDSDYTVLFRFFTEFLLFVSHDLHSLNRLKIQCYPCLSAVLCTCLPRKYCEQGMGW